MIRISFLLLFICLNSLWAAPSFYRYTLSYFPVEKPEVCDAQAKEFGKVLAQETGVRLYTAYCDMAYPTSQSATIVIIYISEKALPEGAGVEEPYGDGYEKYEACEKDLSNQVELFEKATGVVAFANYCTREGLLRIYSLQPSSVKRYALSESLSGDFLGSVFVPDPEKVIGDLSRVLEQQWNVLVSRSTITFFSRLLLYYYGNEPLHLGLIRVPRYESQSLCVKTQTSIESVIPELGLHFVYSFCAPVFSPKGPSTLYTIAIPKKSIDLMIPLELPVVDIAPDLYLSFLECDRDKDRVIAFYQSELGKNVDIGICSLKKQNPITYQLLLLRKKSG